MTEGTLVEWLVDEGARARVGDEIAEVETDKINGAVETPGGRRAAPARGRRGDVVPVGGAARRGRRRDGPRRRDRRLRRRVPGDVRRPARPRRTAGPQPETVEVGGRRRCATCALGEGGDAGRAPARLRRRPQQLAVQPAGRWPRAAPSTRSTCPGHGGSTKDVGRRRRSTRWPTPCSEFLDSHGHRARAPRRPLAGRRGRREPALRRSRPRARRSRWSPRRARRRDQRRVHRRLHRGRAAGASSSPCSSCCSPTRAWSPARWSTTC